MADMVAVRSPFIGGRFVEGTGTPFEVFDPSTGEAFTRVGLVSGGGGPVAQVFLLTSS